MEKPKIKLIDGVKNKTLGGTFLSFYCVKFPSSPLWYAPKSSIIPCSFCKKKNLDYLIFQENTDTNYFYCPQCAGEETIKKLKTRKYGIKFFTDI